MNRIGVLITALLISAPVLGCSIPADSTVEAETIARNYFETIKTHDYNGALKFYGPKFFENTSPDNLTQTLRKVNQTLGDLKTYTLTDHQTNTVFGAVAHDTTYILSYKVQYEKKVADEKLTLFKLLPDGATQIIGQTIYWDPF